MVVLVFDVMYEFVVYVCDGLCQDWVYQLFMIEVIFGVDDVGCVVVFVLVFEQCGEKGQQGFVVKGVGVYVGQWGNNVMVNQFK